MKIAIYTPVFGGYDPEPYNVNALQRENVEFLWITDTPVNNPNGWIIHEEEQLTLGRVDAAKTNRFFKLLPHYIFSTKLRPRSLLTTPDINVYIDGNKQLFDIDLLLSYCQKLWESEDEAYFVKHLHRDKVYQEVREVIRLRRDDPKIIANQYKRYQSEGFPDNIPLIVASVQIRKTYAPSLMSMLDCWWEEVKNNSYRDQISLPYAIWKTGFTRYQLLHSENERCKMIRNIEHRKLLRV